MRGLERVGRPGWRWVALFTVLVVLPAIALTLLSIRAFQGEASRAAFQRRERQQQVLRLLENDLRDWVLSLDREQPASGAVEVFEVRDAGVFLPAPQRLPVARPRSRDGDAACRTERRRSGDGRGRRRPPRVTRRIRGGGLPEAARPKARRSAPWARLALLRLSLQRRNCADAAALLAAIRQKDLAAVTESGIPVWVASALLIKDAGGACPVSGCHAVSRGDARQNSSAADGR